MTPLGLKGLTDHQYQGLGPNFQHCFLLRKAVSNITNEKLKTRFASFNLQLNLLTRQTFVSLRKNVDTFDDPFF